MHRELLRRVPLTRATLPDTHRETIPPERLPARVRTRGDHPTGGEELRAWVLGARRHIERLSHVRELVLGAQDGLIATTGLLTGLAVASVSSATIVLGGVAEIAASVISMAAGVFLSSQAENALFRRAIADELEEMKDHPEIERRELEILLKEEGVASEDARTVSEILARYPSSHVRTTVEKELGLAYGEHRTARADSLVVAATFLVAALIPLSPYLFLSVRVGLAVSLAATAVALIALGIVKARIAGLSRVRSGVQVLLIGSGAAAIGFLVGTIIPKLVES